jgi:23S rRNA (cytidine1920-2'-O)/16S rRNA (cytidine1409-2'-O)-methyltransferase
MVPAPRLNRPRASFLGFRSRYENTSAYLVKQRLDHLLLALNLAPNLEKARALIGAGAVLVNEQRADKAGALFTPEDAKVQVKSTCPFVSRGGLKLQAALDVFACRPSGLICADIGASSGGFTDCLLQRGARKVYAVDVGYGQLDWKLRQNPQVVVIERFNARTISKEQIPEPLDLAVIDSSFISLTKLIPPLLPLFADTIRIIALIKPQFELPRMKVPKGGVILDPLLHDEAIAKIIDFGTTTGLSNLGIIRSPILGPKGNTEFLIHLELKR